MQHKRGQRFIVRAQNADTLELVQLIWATMKHIQIYLASVYPAAYVAATSDLQKLFNNYINPFIAFLSAIAGIVILISIIAGGVQYSAAGADPNKVAMAKQRITNAIVALLCLIFLFAFLQWLVPGGLL